MKNMLGTTLATLMLTIMAHSALAATDTAKGLWKTIDDVTGKPKSIILISETPNRTLQGTVVKIFPRPGYDQNELCTACKGALHNQRIIGMTVLNNLTVDPENPSRWGGGEILDPHNGKTYRCTVQVSDQNQKMNVRGYIGMPLFGRSQTWERVQNLDS